MEFDRQRVIDLREDKKLSQSALAKMIGMKRQQLDDIEKGRHTPGLKTIARIAEKLGVTGKFFIREGGTSE